MINDPAQFIGSLPERWRPGAFSLFTTGVSEGVVLAASALEDLFRSNQDLDDPHMLHVVSAWVREVKETREDR